MDPETRPLSFETGWLSFGLGRERQCPGTYCSYRREDLPPVALPARTDDLAWLSPLSPALDEKLRPYRDDAKWARERTPGNLTRLLRAAEVADLQLPSAFVRLMTSQELQDRIPSCTACYFDLDGRILPCPSRADLRLVAFLVDQQAVVTWYLLLEGHRCMVLASWINLVLDAGEEPDGDLDEAYADFTENTVVCAQDFNEFLYRFWFENVLWFALEDRDSTRLSAEQEQYLDFYRRRQP